MYNPDGTLRPARQSRSTAVMGASGRLHSIDAKENADGPTRADSPKAAGMRSKAFEERSSPLQTVQRPGADARHRAIQGSFSFTEDPAAAQASIRDVSEAKKKALYASTVFNQVAATLQRGPALSQLKRHELSGSNIFSTAAAPEDEVRRGMKYMQPPGGGSSLRIEDSSDNGCLIEEDGKMGNGQEAPRVPPGGQSSLSGGWANWAQG